MNRLQRELIRDEGLRLKPYHCTAGKLTIGVGRNIEDNGITEQEALYLLDNDITTSRRELSAYRWFVNLDVRRQEAVINMHFNLGLPRLLSFKKMIAALEEGRYEQAANEALDSRWATQVGERAVRIAQILKG